MKNKVLGVVTGIESEADLLKKPVDGFVAL
jgi:hypothetical protein